LAFGLKFGHKITVKVVTAVNKAKFRPSTVVVEYIVVASGFMTTSVVPFMLPRAKAGY
jgi:hypothetical protein